MLTSLAVVFSAAMAIGYQTQGADTLSATWDQRDAPTAAPESSAVAPGPRRALARVAVIRETAQQEGGTEASDSVAQRRRAIEYGDWYYRRLAIHKAASFATAPLFVAEYVVGQKLFDGNNASGNLKSTHQALATGIGVLFGVNTVTGAWNVWDSRHETQGRARRLTHAALMLASDAGFVATAALAPEGEDNEFGDDGGASGRSRHRAVAIGSMGVSLVSYVMMYVWK
jgi:hypothetical protein